jgi:hypothetical protein
MDSLESTIAEYLGVAKKLADVNAAAADLRYEKSTIESNLAVIYGETETLPTKIDLTNSKMVFHAKKPGEWKKGWTLSKKQLEVYLTEILGARGSEVFQEIVKRHEPTLIANGFGFELKYRE